MKTIKVPARVIKKDDVVIIDEMICRVTNAVRRELDGKTEYHIYGESIIDEIECSILSQEKHIFDKLVPVTCRMTVILVKWNECSLSYRNEVIEDIELPRTRNNIAKRFASGEVIVLKVDNYLDSYYVIQNNPRE
uniref:Uncharacterized protein n=1 Tax=viral metagenome TaxID=1070528 RepID=A0A6C0C7Y8_9ZZZZ